MPWNQQTKSGGFNVNPNKFTDDDRTEKAPEEYVKHKRLISFIGSLVSLLIVGGFFWFILTI